MNRVILAMGLLGVATVASAAPEWLDKEFTNNWDAPDQGLESFLNQTCQPSGLDGIQMLAVQDGHGRPYHVHVYCRQDKAGARYRVSMPRAPTSELFAQMRAQAAQPDRRIGPFFLGNEGEPNGFLLIERLR
jgi:hypothetical protein